MSQFHNHGNVPTMGEMTGTAPELKADGERCDYCSRAWSKGFSACPQCGLKAPPECPDCYADLDADGKCPECYDQKLDAPPDPL